MENKNRSLGYFFRLSLRFIGGVIALLPIFAEDILKVGPEGLGYLRAAPSIGALITMIALTRFRQLSTHGVTCYLQLPDLVYYDPFRFLE